MLIVVLSTVLAICAMYAPQPLLPVFAREFGVSRDAAAFLTTVVFIPVSLAPLVYGYVLQAVSPRRMLRISALVLAGTEVLFSVGDSFAVLILLRCCQGLLIPAMLTSLMTYVSRIATDATVERKMAMYVAATILGGFLARFLSGAIAELLGWRNTFLVLAFGLGICNVLLSGLEEDSAVVLARPSPGLLRDVLRQPPFLIYYSMVLFMFFSFAAVMNFIPFRLTELSDGVSEFGIGSMYSGYLMGLVSSLFAVKIGRRLGGPNRSIVLGLGVFSASILGLWAKQVPILFAIMFVFCGAMFFVHATTAGLLNKYAGDRKGVVNGLYVAFYYGGGVLGSSLPAPVYGVGGWEGFVILLLGVSLVSLSLAVYGVRHKGL